MEQQRDVDMWLRAVQVVESRLKDQQSEFQAAIAGLPRSRMAELMVTVGAVAAAALRMTTDEPLGTLAAIRAGVLDDADGAS